MKIRKLLNAGVFLYCLGNFSSQAFAYHYGTAGCGLGSLAFHDQPGKIQIVAATLNDLVSPQTFAITSGTSGCYDSYGEMASLYIESNKLALLLDIAKGNGEVLDGLSKIYGCSASSELGGTLKANFSTLTSDGNLTTEHLRTNLEQIIKTDSLLKGDCRELA